MRIATAAQQAVFVDCVVHVGVATHQVATVVIATAPIIFKSPSSVQHALIVENENFTRFQAMLPRVLVSVVAQVLFEGVGEVGEKSIFAAVVVR